MDIYKTYENIFKKYNIENIQQNILYFDNCIFGQINTNIIKSIIIKNNDDNMLISWKNNKDVFIVISIVLSEISDPQTNNFQLIKNIIIDDEIFCIDNHSLLIEKIITSKKKIIIINANQEYMDRASFLVRGLENEKEKWYNERIRDLK